MIGFICIFVILNFLTLKLNQKIIADYTKVRAPLKRMKQTWGTVSDPDHLYFFLAVLLMVNMVNFALMLGACQLIFGMYAFLLLVTYFVIGIIQLFLNFNKVISDCEKISLNKSEFKLNVFWQVIINLICTLANVLNIFIIKLAKYITLPNPIPTITSRIKRGIQSFDE